MCNLNIRVARSRVDLRPIVTVLNITFYNTFYNRFKNNLWHNSGRNSTFLICLLTQKLNGFCEEIFDLYTLIVQGYCGGGVCEFFETRRRQNGRHDGRLKQLRIGQIRLWNRRRSYERILLIVVFVTITIASRGDLGRPHTTCRWFACVCDGNEQWLDCVWTFSAGVVEKQVGNEKQKMLSTFGLSPYWCNRRRTCGRVPCD